MKFSRFPHLRSAKFVPFAFLSLFVLTNFASPFLPAALAPTVSAASRIEKIPADIPLSGDCDLDWTIFRAAEREGVDPRFIHAVIQQESKYDRTALSPVGARGLMQLMPDTAKRFGCRDLQNETCNIQAGTKYLAWLLKRFNGDVKLALAGYNAGEGAVDKYLGSIPPYPETQNYVKRIVSNYGKTYHPVVSPEDARIVFHLDTSVTPASGNSE